MIQIKYTAQIVAPIRGGGIFGVSRKKWFINCCKNFLDFRAVANRSICSEY